MALFRPYERTTKASGDRISELTAKSGAQTAKAKDEPKKQPQEPTAQPVARSSRKKDRPTPTRREAEAARMERLHPTLTPREQRRADARARNEARLAAWDKVEKSPARVLLRDFVDTRWTVAEFMMPAMILIMAAMMAFLQFNEWIASSIGMVLWIMLGASLIQLFFMWRGFRRVLDERLPGTPTRGLLMYMFHRALMLRRFRQPGPRIKRGEAY